MRIERKILNEIINCMPAVPPEAGGIIGGRAGLVCLWEYDAGRPEKGCVYRPNVDVMNGIIAEWIEQDYDFMGIVHVHFGGVSTLSEGDIRYIEKIMEAMPGCIAQLYFPIVVQPNRLMASYIACVNEAGGLTIVKDEIEVI